eukprot:CAMPEP_0184683354 /NCGR_PEP_ID=MMETSP0312-20130426/10969_1 /TAXON_ID=31354 /ORGANISM="Compsopogon coeruleus, Strain SAG 36.94" /LENGTH=463 /DNA_ID=CAMNT_0027135645 /DNA_START=134 /DNA_END=1522 /DNA_ORIENTATION=-
MAHEEEEEDLVSERGIASLVDLVIRPPRASYELSELGSREFEIREVIVRRKDVVLENCRGVSLQCALYEPAQTPLAEMEDPPPTPIVIYLHGNGSCQLEARVAGPMLLPYGFRVFALDFAGSGRSGGDYVSLGVYEKDDLAAAVSYLRGIAPGAKIGIWGHSMGAATAIMYMGSTKPSFVYALVADSPFASFETLAKNMINQMGLPAATPKRLILATAVRVIRRTVRQKAGFDVLDVAPVRFAPHCGDVPVLFVRGLKDTIVSADDVERLHNDYSSKRKRIITVESGGHENMRPENVRCLKFIFLVESLYAGSIASIGTILKKRGTDMLLQGRYESCITYLTAAIERLQSGFTTLRRDPPSPHANCEVSKSERSETKMNIIKRAADRTKQVRQVLRKNRSTVTRNGTSDTAGSDTSGFQAVQGDVKRLLLACCGNRSLAYLRTNNHSGALSDAATCMELDPTW